MGDRFQRLGRRKPLVVGLAFVVVIAVAVVALVMPKKSAVKEQETLLDQARQQTSQLQAEVATLEQDKRDAPHVRAEMKKLEEEMPGVVKLPQMIRQIKSMADEAAVDFVQIAPNVPAAATSGGFSMVPTQIGATGSYFAVTEFLYRLETLGRAVKVNGVTLSPIDANAGPHGVTQLTLQLTTDLFTTDVSAGPGSVPGHTSGTTSTGTVPTSATTSTGTVPTATVPTPAASPSTGGA